jgi:CDP-diacylglycerol--serine O-phosphatidyltransferase
MLRHLPNFITLLNLFFGCCALVFLFQGRYELVPWCTLLSLVADFGDGLVARALRIQSPLGVQLDSLADGVSFGVVQGAVLFVLFNRGELAGLTTPLSVWPGVLWLSFAGFGVSMFSALRLGKFNLDERQSKQFLGLPTPASTIFVVGLLLVYLHDSFGLGWLVTSAWFLVPVGVLLSALMVSEVPMFSFKFENIHWAGNQIRFIFAAVAVVAVVVLRESAFSFLILLYVLVSVIQFSLSGKISG